MNAETCKRPESVLVVLYNEHNQVLVLQRIDDANFWQSVTGTMEGRETPIQTALREVHEETGIRLTITPSTSNARFHHLIDCMQVNQYSIRPKWLYRYPPGITTNLEHVFYAQVPSTSVITLTEHTAYLWLDKPQAFAKVWSNTNKEAIQEFVPTKQT